MVAQEKGQALETVVRTRRGPFSMTVIERRFRGGRFDYEIKYTVESKTIRPARARVFARALTASASFRARSPWSVPRRRLEPRWSTPPLCLVPGHLSESRSVSQASPRAQSSSRAFSARSCAIARPCWRFSCTCRYCLRRSLPSRSTRPREAEACPDARYLLTLLGLVGSTWSALLLTGSGAVGKFGPADREITFMQWNVLWGGGPFRSPSTWAGQRIDILKRDPDIVMLSEPPSAEWIAQLVAEMGPGAQVATIEHDPRGPYWYRMALIARWPVRLEEQITLPGGAAMIVTVSVDGGPIRLLCVDGKSNPFHSRLPFLAAIAGICRKASQQGRPIDIVAGDFNTPSHSIGFEDLSRQGLTWPVGLHTAGGGPSRPLCHSMTSITSGWLGAFVCGHARFLLGRTRTIAGSF